jgi:two-component system sensor histidine kinase AlgZ
MILQPLLENAVAHGIQPSPEGGSVRVFGRLEGARLVITVANPLPGKPAAGGSGMALHNIRSRLALMHGSEASLVTDQDGERFYAILSLPGPAGRG